ncbi:winged helix-turn-helix domain-containing protein [Qipengyuania xiapuensis]|uniref:Winged helix-turn-helix domain-containing protein n=1 Tax=Qipengyuania xiapuensis TaxID=2867236 RepID=A0ABX9A1Y5_9SPHN|nr:winged helix-turn-helix domain-containing protein [Qipengyuania xiapuensis]QZD93318.1 winged helix-turn-helix domain-containing protein [Qipengyuania xiapuensis]
MEEFRIGSHILQPHRQLLLDGEHVHLGPRALSILTLLAERCGEVVTKDELMEAVWPDVTVEENALQVHVTAVRKALGDDAGLLHTLRGIGYQLNVPEALGSPRGAGDLEPPVVDHEYEPVRRSTGPSSLVIAGLGILFMIAAIATVFLIGSTNSPTQQAPTSLAVLPFKASGDDEWREREEAFTASISSNLARVPGIDLVPSAAIDALDGQNLSPQEIGRRLGVDHFIEGDILASDDRLVSQVKLVEARSGRAIWSREIAGSRPHPDEFEALLLTRLSGTILALRRMASDELHIPEDLDPRAYEAYLDGLAFMTARDSSDWQHALRQMQLATSIEPDFAAGHAGAAYVLAIGTNSTFFMLSRDEYIGLYQEHKNKALTLDPESFEVELAEAIFQLNTHGDIGGALATAQDLLEQRPNDSRVNTFMRSALHMAGRSREAVTHVERAMAADPFNRILKRFHRYSLIAAGDYPGVERSASECRIDCWFAAFQWWSALLQHGTTYDYRMDTGTIAEMAEDERAFYSGELGQARSMRMHTDFIFFGDRGTVEWDVEGHDGLMPPSDWLLILLLYGYVDEAFGLVENFDFSRQGVHIVMPLLVRGRLTASDELRADPRYVAMFEEPHIKALVDYRRDHGVTDGLPITN